MLLAKTLHSVIVVSGLKLRCTPLGWTGSRSIIQGHSGCGSSKQPMNPLWKVIQLVCLMHHDLSDSGVTQRWILSQTAKSVKRLVDFFVDFKHANSINSFWCSRKLSKERALKGLLVYKGKLVFSISLSLTNNWIISFFEVWFGTLHYLTSFDPTVRMFS